MQIAFPQPRDKEANAVNRGGRRRRGEAMVSLFIAARVFCIANT